MNKYHQEILNTIKKYSKKEKQTSKSIQYLGHNHLYYGLSVPQKRQIAKEWIKLHKDIKQNEFTDLLNSLLRGESYDEKSLGGILLGYLRGLREQVEPVLLDNWLNYLEGWGEIDSLCQSNFTAEEMLAKWREWEQLIKSFANSENISKKRASLVLLTGVVIQSDDKRLVNLAFYVIDKLKSEKSILVTKAISWLLRDLIKHYRNRVEEYLRKNANSLPKIAILEVTNKLMYGKK